jgi:competence protein ComEA
MPTDRRLVLAALILVLAGLVVAVRLMEPPALESSTELPAPAVTSTADAGAGVGRDDGPVLVHVAGAVRRPGVYRLRAGSRVRDAVRAAGGARPRALLAAVNLAARLADGEQVLLPGPGVAPVAPGAAAAAGAIVHLNSATAEQLDALDGIGPALAERIAAYRTEHGGFRSVDELADVQGIGPARLEALRARVAP